MKSNIKLSLIVVFILLSCKSNFDLNKNRDVIFRTKTSSNEESLSINKNNRFKYFYDDQHLISQSSSGNWIKKGDTIQLTSDAKYKMGIIDFEEKVDESILDKTKITIIDDQKQPIVAANIIINDNDKELWATNYGGSIIIPNQEIKTISIYFLDESPYYYTVTSKDSNSYLLKIRLREMSKKYFDNEIWTIKGRKLFSPDGETYRRSK